MKELQEAIDRLLEVAKKARDSAPSSLRPTQPSTYSEQQRAQESQTAEREGER